MAFSDEILIKMGIDASAVGRGLRSVRGTVSSFADSLKSTMKTLSGPLTAAGMLASMKAAIDMANQIDRTAEASGMGAEAFQRYRYAVTSIGNSAKTAERTLAELGRTIGEAREGSEKAREKFDKWGIALRTDFGIKKTDQVLGDIADKLKAIEDPTRRNLMAVELLGSQAAKLLPILVKGREGLEAAARGASIFSEKDLENLRNADSLINQTQSRLTIWAGKLLGVFGDVAKAAGEISTGIDPRILAKEEARQWMEGRERKQQADFDAAQAEDAVAEAKRLEEQAAELTKAQEKLADAQHASWYASLTLAEKVEMHKRKALRLEMELEEFESGTVDHAKKALEILENSAELKKHELELEKQVTEQNRAQAELGARHRAERERALSVASQSLANSQADMERAMQDRSGLTLEELASRKFTVRRKGRTREVFESGAAADAAHVLDLRDQAREARAHGNRRLADELLAESDSIAATLSDYLRSDEANPMAVYAKNIEDQTAAIKELKEQADGPGLKIKHATE